MMTTNVHAVADNDAELVVASLAGNRDAFGDIVSRYQGLICSLAYSATGSLGQSQDLAQETFITAWKHLRLLRERQKLRAWLCGIARCLIGKALRREGREPTHAAEVLSEGVLPDGILQDDHDRSEHAAAEPLPSDQVISKEEEAILWRSIERIPAAYREPLVLFYREHQSVEKVAAALDLTEDAVKQRLSRGRKLLHQQVLAFVEGALERTSPGKAFTIGVLAALPAFASSATAASLGMTAMKGAATTKAGGFLAVASSLAGPLTGFVTGYVGYKMSMERAGSDKERQFIKRFYGLLTIFIVLPVALIFAAASAKQAAASPPRSFAGIILVIQTSSIPAVP